MYICIINPLPHASLNFLWNSPIFMKGGRECLTCMSPTSLPRSDSSTQFELAQMYFISHYLSLLNGRPHLGGSGRMKEYLNSLLQIQLISLLPHTATYIPLVTGGRRHYLLPPCTCSQYRSPDIFQTVISNVYLSTAQSVLLGTIDRQLLSCLTHFVC